MLPDPDTCYRAVQSRDARFDGWVFTAVRTTGIYCRPSCPAITPSQRNVVFYPSAAAAQRVGFRACKRCRPDASPGSPDWDVRGDLVGRALRLVADGVVDREGVPGLARRLGYSERQINRALLAEVGAGPLALARAQRAQTARVLLETTDLPVADVAFAAGFASVRQFNDTVRQVFATTPTGLRAARGKAAHQSGAITLRLPFRTPMDFAPTWEFLAARAIPGVEAVSDATFSRVVSAPYGPALVTVANGPSAVTCTARLTDVRDLVAVVARLRRLFDLDADPVAIDTALGNDPVLEPMVRKRAGLRSPGAVDGFEMAIRAVVGQQVSVAGARATLGRIAAQYGTVAFDGEPWLTFPSAERLAGADPEGFAMPRRRAHTVRAVAAAYLDGAISLDPGADRDRERAALVALPGIGRWTADYLRMRALSDPDVLLADDLGVRRSAQTIGLDIAGGRPDLAPWRSYVTHHLWAAAC